MVTLVPATCGRPMAGVVRLSGHFVNCRKGSPTLHQSCSLSFKGNPDRSLVIGRGIAHIFDNLMGMTTINQMRMHFDIRNPDFIAGSDVFNILRGTPIDSFPVLRVNCFRSPRWLCNLMVKQQRIGIRRSSSNYPFQFKHGQRNFANFPTTRWFPCPDPVRSRPSRRTLGASRQHGRCAARRTGNGAFSQGASVEVPGPVSTREEKIRCGARRSIGSRART